MIGGVLCLGPIAGVVARNLKMLDCRTVCMTSIFTFAEEKSVFSPKIEYATVRRLTTNRQLFLLHAEYYSRRNNKIKFS